MASSSSSLATLPLLRLAPLHRPSSSLLVRRRLSLLCPISMSSYRRGGPSTVPATDRLVSALSYGLPFFNSLHYGRFLFARFPPLASAFSPLLPLASAYRSVPYASFVAFFALYLGVVRNPRLSRYVRFNSMQAVVLDVLLALPVLAQRILGAPSGALAFRVVELAYGAVFVFASACFAYGLVSCVLGRTPHLPIVASAADRQL